MDRSAQDSPPPSHTPLAELLFAGEHRHVSAEELHAEAGAAAVNVSLATIYNTLHQFQEAGLLREVAIDASRSYFEWSIHAAKLDALEGVDQAQRWSRETRLYDRKLLRWVPVGWVAVGGWGWVGVWCRRNHLPRMATRPASFLRDPGPDACLDNLPVPPVPQGQGGPPAQGAGRGRRRGPAVCAARRPAAQPGQHHQQVLGAGCWVPEGCTRRGSM